MRTILVTGAAGFIGRHVVTHLATLADTVVRAGTRPGGQTLPSIPSVETVVADVRDARTLETAFQGVDVVVNCAFGDRWVTVNGTQAVLAAAREAGVSRVVHLSSTAVYGNTKGVIGEGSPLLGYGGDEDDQDRMKAEAESLCKAAAATGQSVVVLRPGVVMGPGAPFWGETLARRLAHRVWGTLDRAGTGVCNLVDVRDVARAVEAALTASVAPGSAYNIVGPETLSWNAFFAKYNDALGLPDVREIKTDTLGVRILTGGPARLLARHVPALASRVEETLLAAPNFSELDQYRREATYPTDKAARELGWRPAIGPDACIAHTAEWAKAEGLARRPAR
ncbi:NAD-dependent epimerase/dehydratase family protein [Pararhodospirillum oryzae]|uniref:Oxidoreductase n=1 Tax=Pararhodospirillum oryzae TaxID=478448 RepID=A0A512HC38_9PROT|nr:NAD-dependent epimerase/dehydratase family protein [Pararhodospirillum oryzae]GEO82950.1 oxidoreductase [Pararhodospirillum oryzae]